MTDTNITLEPSNTDNIITPESVVTPVESTQTIITPASVVTVTPDESTETIITSNEPIVTIPTPSEPVATEVKLDDTKTTVSIPTEFAVTIDAVSTGLPNALTTVPVTESAESVITPVVDTSEMALPVVETLSPINQEYIKTSKQKRTVSIPNETKAILAGTTFGNPAPATVHVKTNPYHG